MIFLAVSKLVKLNQNVTILCCLSPVFVVYTLLDAFMIKTEIHGTLYSMLPIVKRHQTHYQQSIFPVSTVHEGPRALILTGFHYEAMGLGLSLDQQGTVVWGFLLRY